ncbi:MAG: hypothetical protein AB7T31_08510 [Gemmatimonadales bacterium]
MKEFTDAEGRRWQASAREEPSVDYKGRYYLVLSPAEGSGELLELPEVRWNSERTAARTIATMSTFELRRRLRSALGRKLEAPAS